ncbi:MAG: hypothetical protein KAW16_06950, partial [candidate division Zixibacteria bacterium]|nr:hypothetical protein [candidate division Zixibacteria bacterium]
ISTRIIRATSPPLSPSLYGEGEDRRCIRIEGEVIKIPIDFEPMYCPRCKTRMKESKRPFHKQRKWICPKCGKVRFQVIKKQTETCLGKIKVN